MRLFTGFDSLVDLTCWEPINPAALHIDANKWTVKPISHILPALMMDPTCTIGDPMHHLPTQDPGWRFTTQWLKGHSTPLSVQQ